MKICNLDRLRARRHRATRDLPWASLVGVSCFIGMIACHQDHGPVAETPLVAASPARADTAGSPTRAVRPEPDGWIGIVVPQATVDVVAPRTGRLEAVTVRPGDTVTQGQVLARLDGRGLAQEVRMAEADVVAAEADLQRAQAEADREHEQHQRREAAADVVSREERAAAAADSRAAASVRDAAHAQVIQRRARLDDLHQQRAETVLRAPFDGRVAARYLDTGAMLPEGATVLRLVRDGALSVRFAVPPDDAAPLTGGAVVTVHDERGLALAHATVVQVAPELDIASQMVFAEAVPRAPGHVPADIPSDHAAPLDADPATRLRAGGSVWVRPASEAQASARKGG